MPAQAFPHAALDEDGDELGDTGVGVLGELGFDLGRDHGEVQALTEPHAQRSHDRLARGVNVVVSLGPDT